MADHSIPNFHDALICEALHNLQKMTEAARLQAQAIEAQASMVAVLIDAAKKYGTVAPKDDESLKRHYEVTRLLERIDYAITRQESSPAHFRQARHIFPGDEMSTVQRTREGRESYPVTPMDEEPLVRKDQPIVEQGEQLIPAAPKVDIVDLTPEPPVDVAPFLDERGALVPAVSEHPKMSDKNTQEELEVAAQPETERVADLAPEPAPAPEPVEKPKPPRARAGVPVEEKSAPAPAADRSTKDRILDRYAETGEQYTVLAVAMGLNQNTVASYLSVARGDTDNRVAMGDLMRLEKESAEEEELRQGYIAEASKMRGIKFPEEDQIGTPAYSLNYNQGEIHSPEGSVKLNKQWLRVMDCLKDQDEHLLEEVWKAGRFTNERQLLSQLRDINALLSQVKLYIVADAKHYQLCGLL